MEQRVPLSDAQRLRDLIYHTVDNSTANRMSVLRGQYYALGLQILAELPDCRERSLALTALEESSMRAIQALAVMSGEPVPPTLPNEE